MSDRYITLLGSEEVQRAANVMSSAAREMHQAASNLESTLHQHHRFMDDWLYRLQGLIETLGSKHETLP